MPTRRRAREIALQLLYEDDLNPDQNPEVAEQFLHSRLHGREALVRFARELWKNTIKQRWGNRQTDFDQSSELVRAPHGSHRPEHTSIGHVRNDFIDHARPSGNQRGRRIGQSDTATSNPVRS